MKLMRVFIACSLAALPGVFTAAQNGETAALPEQHRAELAAVEATRATGDDIALAEQLVKDAAAGASASEAERVAMLAKARELGMRDLLSSDVAVRALRAQRKLQPAAADELTQKIIEALRTRYLRSPATDKATSGEALISEMVLYSKSLADKQEYQAARKQLDTAIVYASQVKPEMRSEILQAKQHLLASEGAATQVDDWLAQLKADPENKDAATSLALFLVAVLDQPARGFRLAEQIGSKQLAEQVELASKQPTELTADQTAALAMAFDQLADDVDRAYRAVLLQRAWNHHRLFTRLHEFEDIYIARSNIAMARLERSLATLEQAPVPWPLDALASNDTDIDEEPGDGDDPDGDDTNGQGELMLLMANGRFDLVSPEGWPAHWEVTTKGASGTKAMNDRDGAYARMRNDPADDVRLLLLRQSAARSDPAWVAVQLRSAYRLTDYQPIEGEARPSGAVLRVRQYDAQGNLLLSRGVDLAPRESWSSIRRRITLARRAAKIEVAAEWRYAYGTLDLQHLQVVPVDENGKPVRQVAEASTAGAER